MHCPNASIYLCGVPVCRWALVGLDGVTPSQMVGVSASLVFPCTIESRSSLLAPARLGGPRKMAVVVVMLPICYTVCPIVY